METFIKEIKKVKMNKPILIEGLPGIGLVGKLVADLIIEELKAEKIAELYSPHFPHQVIMQKSGIIKDIKNDFYLIKRKDNDLLILIGETQAITSEAQYNITEVIINYIKKNDCKLIITLGGYGTGIGTKNPKIFGAVNDEKLIGEYSKFDIQFGKTKGAIIGAAGLLLSLGKMKDIQGICIMGETHGGYVDANAAKEMIKVLSKIFDLELSTKKLDNKAKENKKLLDKIQEQTKDQSIQNMGDLNLSYIR